MYNKLPKIFTIIFGEKSTRESLESEGMKEYIHKSNEEQKEMSGEDSLPFQIYRTIFGDESHISKIIDHHEYLIKKGILSGEDLLDFKQFITKQ